MRILIKTLSGKTITLPDNIEPSDTIRYIKGLLEEIENIPIEYQTLFYCGIKLQNYRTLADYNIHQDSLIHLILSKTFPIYVNILGEKKILIDVNSSTKIENIKSIIEEDIKIPIDEQILIYSDKILENDNPISYYNIESEDIIICIFFYKIINIKYNNILIKIRYNENDTILNLKKKLEEKLDGIKILNLYIKTKF